MLLSTKFILSGLDSPYLRNHEKYLQLKNWFLNYENSQIDKPSVKVEDEEKAVVLYCNDDLFNLVKKYEKIDLKTMNFLDGIAIWKEIKKIMEKKN